MWEFVWSGPTATEIEAIVCMAILVMLIWLAPRTLGPRKEEQWPFGIDTEDKNGRRD